MGEDILKILASLIDDTKKTDILKLRYFVLFFIIISLSMLYISTVFGIKDNSIVNSIGTTSFYIFTLFGFVYLIAESANKVETKGMVNNNIKELRIQLVEKLSGKGVEKSSGTYKTRGNLLYFTINNTTYSIGYILNDSYDLECLWIYSGNEDIVEKFGKDIGDSEKEYKNKFLEIYKLPMNILPKNSQNLSKKSITDIVKLIEGYIDIFKSKI